VSAIRSGAVLLFTFIGGVGFFFGPMIGSIIGVFLTVMLSDFTKAWQLYLGIFFIMIVMYAPGGVASILMLNLRLVKFGKFARVWPSMWKVCLAALFALVGVIMCIEMLYHLTLESANGTEMKLFGTMVDTAKPTAWAIALGLLAVGGYAFRLTQRGFTKVWGEVSGEIEDQIRKAAA
ncbi:MAG TPA: branched-chain amino acid ABC transporter permease, partial [Noviherbaspirillum sp.]